MSRDYYDSGNWNAICSMCGAKFKASELRKHWQGQYRCPSCWEPRHPQDFVRPVADLQTPPWTQPRGRGHPAAFCTPNGMTSISGFSIAGCWIAGYTHPAFDPTIITLPLI